MEPTTGAVRAMWSYPSYDPNLVANPDFDAASDVLTFLRRRPGKPLLANAYQQRYMPGSTFKVLTTGIALRERRRRPRPRRSPTRREWVPPQTNDPIQNYERHDVRRRPHRGVRPQLQHPVRPDRRSTLGAERMVARRRRLGRRRADPDRPARARRPARSATPTTSAQNLPLLAIRGFGQNEDQMVPLHMAMVAATVANGGQMMKPYVVDADARPRRQRARPDASPRCGRRPISPATADILTRPDDRASPSAARRAAASPSTAASRSPPRPAPPSSTAPASRSARTPGSSPSPRPTPRSTPSP